MCWNEWRYSSTWDTCLRRGDDDIQAIRAQLRKTRATWARVRQVLRVENAPPCIMAKFYKAVVQAVLLYGSETWVLSTTALASLEGFHIRAAYQMAVRHKLRREDSKSVPIWYHVPLWYHS